MPPNSSHRVPRLLMLLLLALLGACATLKSNFVKEPSSAIEPATDTPTARYVRAEVADHADESGFRLLTLSANALMSRVVLADHAQHSIDLQYYIFKNDATGRLVAQRLLAAADRGVRVRLLLDHIKVEGQIRMLEALDAHQNIEVRFFNPFRTKRPSMLSKVAQLMLEGRRLNRRMHNKSFIVDNVVAVVGGRNIGDDYFDVNADKRFADMDLIAIGKVVPQASKSFDAYWNCPASFPLTAFRNAGGRDGDLTRLREELTKDVRTFAQSDYAQAVMQELPDGPTADRHGEWFWGPAVLVADQPEKIEKADKKSNAFRIGPQLDALMNSAQSELILISPYFIPGENGTSYLTAMAQRGVGVKVLTNSLASTDEPLVHAAYVRYRRPLLEGGVGMYELRPAAVELQAATVRGGSSGVSLHAKAFVVDRRAVFVGSMNMDPRSQLLNTEMGLIVESKPLADAVTRFFETATTPENAYSVKLDPAAGAPGPRKLIWIAKDGDTDVRYSSEPGADAKRRLQVMIMRMLPIDGLL